MRISATRLVAAESARWSRDTVALATVIATVIVAAGLTYLAILAAAGAIETTGGAAQIETDTVLGATATDADVASMLSSSLVMALPISAIVIGTRYAGAEMSSGGLLTLAVAVRRLRALLTTRAAVLALNLAALSLVTAAIVCVVGDVALPDQLAHLSAWAEFGPLALGALAQSMTIGLLVFSLAVLTRRWIAVLIGAVVYVVVLEPAVHGILGTDVSWLPRGATSGLVAPDAAWLPFLPTALVTAGLVSLAIFSLRRDRAFRS